uniref:Secreted protein n=1 Tax=Cucumis melo TaxID=3656 RepID=A0A9I9EHL9_CUCME
MQTLASVVFVNFVVLWFHHVFAARCMCGVVASCFHRTLHVVSFSSNVLCFRRVVWFLSNVPSFRRTSIVFVEGLVWCGFCRLVVAPCFRQTSRVVWCGFHRTSLCLLRLLKILCFPVSWSSNFSSHSPFISSFFFFFFFLQIYHLL